MDKNYLIPTHILIEKLYKKDYDLIFQDFSISLKRLEKIEDFILNYFIDDLKENPFNRPFFICPKKYKFARGICLTSCFFWESSMYNLEYFKKVFTLYLPILQKEILMDSIKEAEQETKKIHKI